MSVQWCGVLCGMEEKPKEMEWEDQIADWMNEREMITHETFEREKIMFTPAIASVLSEYQYICNAGKLGKVMVLYGLYGSSKTMTLRALVQGPFNGSWCPVRSLYVEHKDEECGNRWFDSLEEKLECTEEDLKADAGRFAETLVDYAMKSKGRLNAAKEKMIKKKSTTVRLSVDISELPQPDQSFDDTKKPVIAIDNVDFAFEASERKDDKHSKFFSFVKGLKDSAHSAGVVVVLGTKNLDLAKAMSVLNGFTKIALAEASCQFGEPGEDRFIVTCEDTEESRYLRRNMGWTEQAMKNCVRFVFPDLPADAVERISKQYCGVGNIRLAIDAATKTEVSLTKIKTSATSTTAESSEATPSSLSDGFGAITMDSSEALSGPTSLADELSPCSTNDTGDGTDLGDGS